MAIIKTLCFFAIASGAADPASDKFSTWKAELCTDKDYPVSLGDIGQWLRVIDHHVFSNWGNFKDCETLFKQYPANVVAGATCRAYFQGKDSDVGAELRTDWKTEDGCTSDINPDETTKPPNTDGTTKPPPNTVGSASTLGFSALAVLLVATA